MDKRLGTPPLAPKVVAALAELGIFRQAELCEFDPCRAFLLLKQMGLSITNSVFWQMVAVCEQTMPPDLSSEQRLYWQEKLLNYPPVAIFPCVDEMEGYMRIALAQAEQAAAMGEIPVGAVLVQNGEILVMAHNRCVADCAVGHHAEMLALMQAGQALQNYRLMDCDLYVTLEPCAMCAGAIVQARIRRLIFAATEPKMGAAGSVLNVFDNKKLNAHTAVHSGILAQESRALLQRFFAARR